MHYNARRHNKCPEWRRRGSAVSEPESGSVQAAPQRNGSKLECPPARCQQQRRPLETRHCKKSFNQCRRATPPPCASPRFDRSVKLISARRAAGLAARIAFPADWRAARTLPASFRLVCILDRREAVGFHRVPQRARPLGRLGADGGEARRASRAPRDAKGRSSAITPSFQRRGTAPTASGTRWRRAAPRPQCDRGREIAFIFECLLARRCMRKV